MLTKIQTGTNVPTDKQVVATNNKDIVKVGFLVKGLFPNEWNCLHEGGVLHKVTHFMTVENFLKTK